jgi:hypothetical protein
LRDVQTDITGHRIASDGESHRATAPGARYYIGEPACCRDYPMSTDGKP